MKISDLKKQIEKLPDDMEVYIRCTLNPCGNIILAGKASKDTYGFFGQDIPCVIIEPLLDDSDDEGR
jgi:hypothetical protein